MFLCLVFYISKRSCSGCIFYSVLILTLIIYSFFFASLTYSRHVFNIQALSSFSTFQAQDKINGQKLNTYKIYWLDYLLFFYPFHDVACCPTGLFSFSFAKNLECALSYRFVRCILHIYLNSIKNLFFIFTLLNGVLKRSVLL